MKIRYADRTWFVTNCYKILILYICLFLLYLFAAHGLSFSIRNVGLAGFDYRYLDGHTSTETEIARTVLSQPSRLELKHFSNEEEFIPGLRDSVASFYLKKLSVGDWLKERSHGILDVDGLPFISGNRDYSDIYYYMTLDTGWVLPRYIQIAGENCVYGITINNHVLDLSSYDEDARCDYPQGIVVPVERYLQPGANKLAVHIYSFKRALQGNGSRLQLYLGNMWASNLRAEVVLGIWLSGLAYLLIIISPIGRRFDVVIAAILAGDMLLNISYFYHYHYFFHGADVGGHRDYLYYLFRFHAIPAVHDGFQTYQPPLYYLLSLPFSWLGSWVGASDVIEISRYAGGIYNLIYLTFAIATLQLLVRWRPAVYLAAACMAYVPSLHQSTTLLNNDPLLYPFCAATVYFCIKWQRTSALFNLWSAIAIAFVGIAVKSSGLANLVMILSIVLIHCFLMRIPLKTLYPGRRTTLIVAVIIAVSLGLNFGRTLLSNDDPRLTYNFLFNNLDRNSITQGVSASINVEALKNTFFTFHRHEFFGLPPNPRGFWSGLFYRMLFTSPSCDINARSCGFAMALMCAAFFYSLLSFLWFVARHKRIDPFFLAPAIGSVCAIGGLVVLQLCFHAVVIRYFLYFVVWPLMFYAKAIDWHHNNGRKVLTGIGYGLGVIMLSQFIYLICYEIFIF